MVYCGMIKLDKLRLSAYQHDRGLIPLIHGRTLAATVWELRVDKQLDV